MKWIEDRFRDLLDNTEYINIQLTGVLKEEERKKGYEKIFEEIIVETLLNMGK